MKNRKFNLTLNNRPGAISRVAGMLTSKGYEIKQLSGRLLKGEDIFQLCLVVGGSHSRIAQVEKLLYRLFDVIEISD